MASWNYGMDNRLSSSDGDEHVAGDNDSRAGPPAPSQQASTGDLYRFGSLGSGGLVRTLEDDSAAATSPIHSPSQSRQQFVPIQFNLSHNSLSAIVGSAAISDDIGSSAWSATPVPAEACARHSSMESSRHIVPSPVPPLPAAPTVSPVVPTVPNVSTRAVRQADSVSTVAPELLSQTVRFRRSSPTATATPPSYYGMPPSVSRTGERSQQRPATSAFPPAPPKFGETSIDTDLIPVRESSSATSSRQTPASPRPPPSVIPAPPPQPRFSAGTVKESDADASAGVSPSAAVETAAASARQRGVTGAREHPHLTPLEILRMNDGVDDDTTAEPAASTSHKSSLDDAPPPPSPQVINAPPPPTLHAELTEPPNPVHDGEAQVSEPSSHRSVDVPLEPSQVTSTSSQQSETETPSSVSRTQPRVPLQPPPSHPPPELTASVRSGSGPIAERFFSGLAPLIAQRDFRKTDIKKIACTADYTMVNDMAEYEVSVERLAVSGLAQLEPQESICRAYEKLGRLRHRRREQKETTGKPASRVVPVTCEDLSAPLVRYDRLLYAICFCLWESLLPYNDLVDALRTRFFEHVQESADTVQRIPASILFRWLNEYGIDVLVVSRDRRAASSFCARRSCLVRNGFNEEASAAQWTEAEGSGAAPRTANPMAPPSADVLNDTSAVVEAQRREQRVLVAVEFDARAGLWGPLTLSRSISEAAAARRKQREATAREERRRVHKAAREAVRLHRAERVRAKREAWERMVDALRETPPAGADDASSLVHITKRKKHRSRQSHSKNAVEMHRAMPSDVQLVSDASDDSLERSQSTGDKVQQFSKSLAVPFTDLLYPTVEPADFGVGPVLSRAASAWLPRTRLRLLLGVLWGLLTVVFGIAAVAYISHQLRACAFDESVGMCVLDDTGSTTECPTVLSTSLDSTLYAHRSLYGHSVGLGNCLIVCAACGFTGLVFCVLVAFFATRAVLVKSRYPRFAYVVFLVHLLLCAVVCAFAAYAVSLVVKGPSAVRCAWLPQGSVPVCEANYARCPGWHYQVEWRAASARRTALALTACTLAFAALGLFSALIPPLPAAATREKFKPAVPDTSGFQASYFTPDGVLPHTAAQIRAQLEPYLARSLQNSLQESASLVTNTITVAEMMRENREQSIRMMELAKTRRRGLAVAAESSLANARTPTRRIGYTTVRDPDGERHTADQDDLLKNIALSPYLSSRIRAVQHTMRTRRPSPSTAAEAGGPQPHGNEGGQPPLLVHRTSGSGGGELSGDSHSSAFSDGSAAEVETVWRDASSSVPPLVAGTGAALTDPAQRIVVSVQIRDSPTTTAAVAAEPDVVLNEEPPKASILAPGSVARRQRTAEFDKTTTGVATAPLTAPSTNERCAFGGAPAVDRRADHHVRTMKDNIGQIVQRVAQQRDQGDLQLES